MTREEAIKIIKSECYVFNPFNFDSARMINTALDMAIKALEQEPRKGHWQVKDTYPQECECWDCSECQETVFEKSNFCPNCGEKMEVEE